MHKRSVLLGAALLALSFAAPAFAACTCECVDGRAQNICQRAHDIKPACTRTCPPAPPAVKPIAKPAIPPVGMTKCDDRQVLNARTNKYEWRQVCE